MAGEATARVEAKRLAEFMRARGFAVSVELQQGRGEWHVAKYDVMNHHTATHKGSNPTPALGICKAGRPDVPGPLCNGYGGYDGVFRIITMGLANHPGQGGPVTIDGVHIPRDSARGPTFGIEWEGGYHSWTADERRWMAGVNAALLDFYGRPRTSQLEHKTWAPTRKVDRKDMTRDSAIADVHALGSRTTTTGATSLSAAEVTEIKKHIDLVGVQVASFITRGLGNQLLNPTSQPWTNDLGTRTLNEVFDSANMAGFFAKLVHDLLSPNGFGYVDPATGKLVPQGTEGAVPAYDVWRWARESVTADREDDARQAQLLVKLDEFLAELQEFREEERERDVEDVTVPESPAGGA